MSTKTTALICPKCGGELEIEPACVIGEPVAAFRGPHFNADHPFTWSERVAPAALCSRCEFCIEIEVTL